MSSLITKRLIEFARSEFLLDWDGWEFGRILRGCAMMRQGILSYFQGLTGALWVDTSAA
jgi:hypothetical protein